MIFKALEQPKPISGEEFDTLNRTDQMEHDATDGQQVLLGHEPRVPDHTEYTGDKSVGLFDDIEADQHVLPAGVVISGNYDVNPDPAETSPVAEFSGAVVVRHEAGEDPGQLPPSK